MIKVIKLDEFNNEDELTAAIKDIADSIIDKIEPEKDKEIPIPMEDFYCFPDATKWGMLSTTHTTLDIIKEATELAAKLNMNCTHEAILYQIAVVYHGVENLLRMLAPTGNEWKDALNRLIEDYNDEGFYDDYGE